MELNGGHWVDNYHRKWEVSIGLKENETGDPQLFQAAEEGHN